MHAAVKYSLAGIAAALLCTGIALLYRNVRAVERAAVCGQVEVSFADSLRFVSEQDVREYLDSRYGPCIGERLDSVGLARIEDLLETLSAIINCEAWTTDDGVLHVQLAQRAPVLRFQDGAKGFYVDADGYIFPLHPSYDAPVPVVEGSIPVDIPDGFKGFAEDPRERAWVAGMLEMERLLTGAHGWPRHITRIQVRPGGDLVITLEGHSERFIIGQPDALSDKLQRIDRYFGVIAPTKPEGWYKTVNVKYNQQIICRQKDT